MLPTQKYLHNLPYLSREEFENACVELADRSQRLGQDIAIAKASGAVCE